MFVSALFLDNLIEVAKRELAWEVDYERESECTKKFKALLEPYPIYYVPRVIGKSCCRLLNMSVMNDLRIFLIHVCISEHFH